jgi:hypothetical protein
MNLEERDEWIETYKALEDEIEALTDFLKRFFRDADVKSPSWTVAGDPLRGYSISSPKFRSCYTIRLSVGQIPHIYLNIDVIIRVHEELLRMVWEEVMKEEGRLGEIRDRLAPILVARGMKDG